MNLNNYKGYYNIVSNESKKEATIFIYGVIGGFDFEKWKPINKADKFVSDFNALDAKIIHVKINSPGGNVWDGLPIYNTLKNSKKTIYTYVDGIAYSMASLIALSGDKVYGYNNSMIMFHNGSTYVYGNAKEMRKEANTLDKYDEALGSIIEEKLNISAEEVKEKYLNYSNNYFVGKEAKEIGFFNEIITTKEADVPENIKEMSPTDLIKHYAKLNFTEETPSTRKTQSKNNSKKNPMSKLNVPLIEAVIGASFSEGETENGIILTDEQATALENRLSENDTALATAKTEATTSSEKITELEATNTTMTTAIQNALATAEVEEATTMSNEEGITALSNLVAEYGSKDGAATTKPIPNANQPDNENPNVIGGTDMSEYLNN